MSSLHGMVCCGIKELHGIQDSSPRFVILDALCLGGRIMSKPAHIIFTQAGAKSKYGYVFADYIRKHHLGVTIECARRAINLNTRRTIITWIWTPDYNALDKWASRSRHVIG